MTPRTPSSYDDYTVGWICALPLEMAAARLMLDSIHPSLPRPSADNNTYVLGNIGNHNIVIACLPSGAYGTISAATVAMQLLSSFRSIRFGLMVGIGGGVPSSSADIRLGDIVVSQPAHTSGGVIQFDLGKALSGGQFQRTGMLNRPPKALLTALAALQASHFAANNRIQEFLSEIQTKTTSQSAANFIRPAKEDYLFQVDYYHEAYATCINCDRSKLIQRPSRVNEEPIVHYGLIASANQVVKDSRLRDLLAQELGVYCVEMEAAGLMNDFPCLVIRGICDYADSHKNKEWQGYAAAVAAAYAKELLLVVPIDQVNNSPMARDPLEDSVLASKVLRFNVPLDLTAVPTVESFLGRQDELKHLWKYLQPVDFQSRKVAILHGLGGIGKTQLAIRFARDHKHDFTAIFWLNGKDRLTLLQSLSSNLPRLPGQSGNKEAINEAEVKKRAKDVLQWLALEGNSRWLVIFDNIDQYSSNNSAGSDEAYDIGDFFPVADHGSILITSRLQELAELGKSFMMHKLDSEDSIQLLLQSSRLLSAKNAGTKHESTPDLITLASRLDGLPLAIVIAGAFMRQTGTSASEYLHYYEDSWSDLQFQSKPGRQYQHNLLQTWMISYREIERRDPNAALMLLLLARYDNRDTWYELVKNSRYSSDLPVWLDRAVSSKLAFKTGVRSLIEFSFLDVKEQDGSYAMHPVVQDWCLQLASANEKPVNSTQLDELALISVGYTVPDTNDRNYAELQQRLIPHSKFVRNRNFSDSNIALWGAFNGLGNLFRNQGKLKDAEDMYRRALLGKEKALGPNEPSTLNTVNNLGLLFRDQGRLEEAEGMYRRALAGSEKNPTLGLDHTSTLRIVNNLGILYYDQGRPKEAEEMYQRARTGYAKALGLHHSYTLDSVNNLALLYSEQGKMKEAEEMFHQALSGHEESLGLEHPSTLNIVNNLGLLYFDQGRLKEAEQMFQRALVGKEKALGLDHTSTLNTVNNLGLLYLKQGMLKKAEDMYQRALAGKEKVLGLDHTSTLDTVDNLGLLFRDQGKLEEAEKMFRRALAGREKVLGLVHTSTLGTVNNLGNLYSDQGRLKEAEGLHQRALIGYERALGSDHMSTLDAYNNLGNLYRTQGKLKEAEEMYQRAQAGKEKALGLDHTSTLDTVNNLGLLFRDQGKLEEAEKMLYRALLGLEKALGLNHPSTLGTVNNLGNLYSDQGKLKKAEEMYQRALVGYEQALGPDHTSTLNAVNNLGLLYSDQDKLKEAEEMYQRALAGKEKALGLDHTSTLDTVNNLALLYSEQGKLKEAEGMFHRALIGYESIGPKHTSTLSIVNNLANLYSDQGKLKEAEEMYQRALAGYEQVLGPDHTSTLNTVNNLGVLYYDQKQPKKAREMYQRALTGFEKVFGPDDYRCRGLVKSLAVLRIADGK
ncbi:hypothetical protein N7451_002451 [Penicillium sp. IBT 35674x]|nr:hypothetical protein N7451_002451 [Penicillium sp. IBT 35674x]